MIRLKPPCNFYRRAARVFHCINKEALRFIENEDKVTEWVQFESIEFHDNCEEPKENDYNDNEVPLIKNLEERMASLCEENSCGYIKLSLCSKSS